MKYTIELTDNQKKQMDALKKWFLKYFDYDIVGEYLDHDGTGYYKKKYIKKWRLRRRK